MPTNSTIIIEHLKMYNQPFTSVDVGADLPNVSKGAITGLLAKLKRDGYLKQVGVQGKTLVYAKTELDLKDYNIRNVHSVGGKAGRTMNGVSKKERMVNSLFAIIEELENMKGDLSDFSTHELLKEIEKRTQHNG